MLKHAGLEFFAADVIEEEKWARAENRKLMPLCPFAKSVFDKTAEYSDVLAP